jgi:FkbM family methyltransferase
VLGTLKGALRRAGLVDRHPLKGFLRHATGVIHVGAHTGQERELYAQYGLRVLWIEPLPELFAQLAANIARFADQRAVQCLVTDRDGAEYPFHVASNAGGSSSILELALHKEVWPEVTMTRTVTMRSKTLPTLLADERIDPKGYDALVLDTQGSELLVLRGAEPLLPQIRYVKTEAAEFEAYKNCCTLADLAAFLAYHGFRELGRKEIARHKSGGAYFDVVFGRSST